MCMGRTHGLMSAVAGLSVGAAMGLSAGPRLILGGASFVAGYIPDIDHRNSTITRFVPILGSLASWLARGFSRSLYAATKGPRDEDCSGEHRHATHTLLFAVAFGALIGFGAFVAAVRLGVGDPQQLGVLVGGGVALGCFVHCLGDALTLSGCPFLFPLPIRGEFWYELRPPIRFRTGGPFETLVLAPAMVVAVVLLLPGVWPVVVELWDAGRGAMRAEIPDIAY